MQEKTLTYESVLVLIQETNKNILDLRESQARTDEQLAKTDSQLAKTDQYIKNLGKELGNLGNSFGRYSEGMLGPSIRKILTKLGAESTFANVKDLKKNRFEFDYLGTVNSTINKAIFVEVKSTLSREHITKFIQKLKVVSEEITDYKGKSIFGAIAAITYLEEDRLFALENGLYFMSISEDIAHLDTLKNFKAKAF